MDKIHEEKIDLGKSEHSFFKTERRIEKVEETINWKTKIKDFFLTLIVEFIRVAYMSVVPIIYTGINTTTGIITINWKVVIALAIVAGIRALDRALHESGLAEKGIVRF